VPARITTDSLKEFIMKKKEPPKGKPLILPLIALGAAVSKVRASADVCRSPLRPASARTRPVSSGRSGMLVGRIS
jgi:hypothetical protein